MRLKIYVSKHCWGCDQASSLAVQVGRLYPNLAVELIDLAGAEAEQPAEIFATPTYLLDGQVISLGNPKLERLCELIEAELAALN